MKDDFLKDIQKVILKHIEVLTESIQKDSSLDEIFGDWSDEECEIAFDWFVSICGSKSSAHYALEYLLRAAVMKGAIVINMTEYIDGGEGFMNDEKPSHYQFKADNWGGTAEEKVIFESENENKRFVLEFICNKAPV